MRTALARWREQRLAFRIAVVLLVVGVTMGVYRQLRRSADVDRHRVAFEAMLADARSRPERLYVCWEAAMPFELVSPLDSLQSWTGIQVFNLTWTQRTCWQEALKGRLGIDSLAQAILARDDVVLVATPAHRALFATFAQEHFGADVEFVESLRASPRLVAGRFQHRGRSGAARRAAPASAFR
jgi:hypothetical protein